jgi:hypothetical protein
MTDSFFFDPSKEEGSHFDLIPPGEYVAEIIEAEIKQPRSGDGHMLALTWRVSEGDYEGRQVWESLCFQHSNEQTQAIARRKLKDICAALEINEQITDPEVFKFKPVRVRIGIQVDKSGQYDDSNKISRVRALEDDPGEPTPAPSSKPKPQPTAGNGPGKAPWRKSA